MADPSVATAFLIAEVEALEPLDFIAVVPSGRPLHVAEINRREDGGLEVSVPGRPRSVPELDADVRRALRERGFSSEDPANAANPWTKAAPEAEAAVDQLTQLLVEVFGEKPELKLDIAHGSRKLEHEAKKKLALARVRIESVVAEILGRRPDKDNDGDYVVPMAGVHLMVAPRAMPNGRVVIRVFAITNVGVVVTPELGLFLARLNFGLMFGRFALDPENRSIWFDESILGSEFREEELRFAIEMVASTADTWDDRLKQMFGGVTHEEMLAGRSAEAPPPTKPGEGVGMYL